MKKSSLKRGVKKYSPTHWRKKCVTWAKLEARRRDGDRCQFCGVSRKQGYSIHGSHILPEGAYVSMSADPENIIALCAVHHLSGANPRMGYKEPSWHGDPLFFASWFKKKWPGRYEKLLLKARKLKVIDWEKKWKEIKQLGI